MKRYLISFCMVIVLSAGAFAQTTLQPIAEVKLTARAPITLGQLKTRVSALEKELGRKMTVEERKQTLDGLINEKLIVQAAEKDGIKIMDSEVNNYFNEYVSSQLRRQVTETDFAQLIKENTNMSLDEYMKAQNGMTLAEFKNFLRTQLTAQAYVMQKKQKELQSIASPSDDQIRSYYEVNKQSFVQPDIVQLFLVVAPKENKAGAAKKTIEDIQKKLTANIKATTEIRTKSQEKNSAYQAGELFVSKTELAAEQLGMPMEELLKIFKMKTGEVSPVIETGANYQCFVVLEKKDAKILGLSDVVEPGGNISLYEYIKKMVIMQRQNEALNNALVSVTNDLRKAENFKILQTGADFDKTLSW
ncbi:MOSP complex formation periplasmic protein, TDE1658 family [Treponema sp.]|uniref:MOSP complex formation periplasmic protein, TDE1658 family n=1 Tax=Treponema sp. TaxID=166 RepID=UPI003FA22B7C